MVFDDVGVASIWCGADNRAAERLTINLLFGEDFDMSSRLQRVADVIHVHHSVLQCAFCFLEGDKFRITVAIMLPLGG